MEFKFSNGLVQLYCSLLYLKVYLSRISASPYPIHFFTHILRICLYTLLLNCALVTMSSRTSIQLPQAIDWPNLSEFLIAQLLLDEFGGEGFKIRHAVSVYPDRHALVILAPRHLTFEEIESCCVFPIWGLGVRIRW